MQGRGKRGANTVRNKLLIATTLAALVVGTGIAAAETHSTGNLSEGQSGNLNRGKVQPDATRHGMRHFRHYRHVRYHKYRDAQYQ
jgi:hypothetical protein